MTSREIYNLISGGNTTATQQAMFEMLSQLQDQCNAILELAGTEKLKTGDDPLSLRYQLSLSDFLGLPKEGGAAMTNGNAEAEPVRTDHRTKMDWQQVVLNGGPPCFYDDRKGWYCGRAQRWAGHGSVHQFVPLEALVADALLSRWNREMLTSAENDLKEIRVCDKCDLCEDHHGVQP